MRFLVIGALLASTVTCYATDVGIFDNSRMLGYPYNVETGSVMVTFREAWEARGAVWHQTSTLTPEFLAEVRVFFTGKLNNTLLTEAEKTAVHDWVLAGGTLITTGECGG